MMEHKRNIWANGTWGRVGETEHPRDPTRPHITTPPAQPTHPLSEAHNPGPPAHRATRPTPTPGGRYGAVLKERTVPKHLYVHLYPCTRACGGARVNAWVFSVCVHAGVAAGMLRGFLAARVRLKGGDVGSACSSDLIAGKVGSLKNLENG